MRVGINGTFWNMETTGSGQYLRRLLQALPAVADDIECRLFLPGRDAPAPLPRDAVSLGTPLDRLGDNLAKVWLEQVAFPRACRTQGMDLAHVPYFAPPLSPTIPTVVTIHDIIPLILPEYRGNATVRGYMRLVSRAARNAHVILTDSHASAGDISAYLGIPPHRVWVVHLAAGDEYRPVPAAAREETLRRLGLDVAPYLLYLGGFDVRKNVPLLLEAYARCRERLGDVPLVIAGHLPEHDSAFAPDPRPVARRLGIEDGVWYTGRVDEADKPALYSGALAFVFPSRYEGFGLPVLEAISCGVPAVVADGSSLGEVAGPGGLVVPPDDVEALAGALVRLAEEPDLRATLSTRGLEHAARFSWEETARQTVAAYRDALAPRPRAIA
ncbi:MAG TPA: glycosyltransferase family 4 protein [Chloroflexi bacterium]|jgi:glycosyltransferase involved in cell wall biosynthesis|nr:glycosyltransferase family 4 protein [Chloroflexota bacterium]